MVVSIVYIDIYESICIYKYCGCAYKMLNISI